MTEPEREELRDLEQRALRAAENSDRLRRDTTARLDHLRAKCDRGIRRLESSEELSDAATNALRSLQKLQAMRNRRPGTGFTSWCVERLATRSAAPQRTMMKHIS